MRYNQFVDNIAHDIGKENDKPLKSKILSTAISIRATLIRREYDRTGFIPNYSIHELRAIELVRDNELREMDTRLSKLIDSNYKDKPLVSKFRIPEPVRFKHIAPFFYVGESDRSYAFDFIQAEDLAGYMRMEFGSKRAKYTYMNGHIYIFGREVKAIDVKGVFDNPILLEEIKNINGSPCLDYVELESDLEDQVARMIYARMRLRNPELDNEIEINDND